jgi:hypothetical protein
MDTGLNSFGFFSTLQSSKTVSNSFSVPVNVNRRELALVLFTLIAGIQYVNAQDIKSLVIHNVEEKILLKDYLQKSYSDTECRFYYPEDLLDDIFLYETDNGKLLYQQLEGLLKPRGIAYIIYKDVNLVIVERNQLYLRDQSGLAERGANGDFYSTVDIGDPVLAGKYKKANLSGYVRNGKTGEPLPGTVIYIGDLSLGVVSDMRGYYHVELPVGKKSVKYSFVGFEEREMMVNMISPGSFDVELFESTVAIDQVVIVSNGDANISSAEMGIIRMDAKTISNIPVLLGEPDLLKTMTLLPGIQSSGDMASGFNVRGGGSDQNLILIDEVPIYNSNHLFGLFSIIDTRTIKKLELYKGGAPARYGGRASSVMNIDLKEGNLKHIEGDAALGIFSSALAIQGPLVKEKASFLISGRTTYSDWILKRLPDIDLRRSEANFYDLNIKLNYTMNHNNRFSIFAYGSKDFFNLSDKNTFGYTNRLASVRWSHIATDNLTFSVSGFYSGYTTTAVERENPVNAYQVESGIQHTGARIRALFSKNSKHSFEAGIEGNMYNFTPGIKDPWGEQSTLESELLESEKAMEFAGYLQDAFEISDRISLLAGIRYSAYYYLGPKTVNEYSEGEFISASSWTGSREYEAGKVIQNYSGIEPRLGLRMTLTPSSSAKVGLSRNYQYLHIISNSTVVTPTDIWKPSDIYIKPAMADQVMLGYFYNINKGVYETSAEIYYKEVENILEYKGGAQLVMNENLEQDILSADLRAYGIEFLVRKNSGRLTGWVSYTFSRSFLQTSGAVVGDLVNQGDTYASYYDKPNDLSVVTNYKISRRFTFGASFVYSTGRPATYPESTVRFYGNIFPDFSNRNKYRQRDYHRLDLSLTWDTSLKKQKKYYSSWILSVYNTYGHKNVYSTYYKKEVPTAMNDYKRFAFYELSIIGVPIPSVTYNVRF